MLKTALRNVSYKSFQNLVTVKKTRKNFFYTLTETGKVNLDGLASDLYPALPNRPDK